MGERVEIVVQEGQKKMRLEDLLLDHFRDMSKMYLRELVKTAVCEVNGRHENIGYRLRSNDLIEIEIDRTRGTAMRAEQMPLDIAYEDAEIIVLNKPAEMLVHPSHRENAGTLLNGLSFYLNRDPSRPPIRPGLIHRLDKQTSGLIVVAKTARAHRILCAHFMKKRVEKRYTALVEGRVKEDSGTINAPIGRFAELKLWSVHAEGKASESKYKVIERRSDATVLQLEPVTGRTNQLRIHCQAIGHPIVGDTARGGRLHDRLCLHASSISFPHPTGGEMVRLDSPINFFS